MIVSDSITYVNVASEPNAVVSLIYRDGKVDMVLFPGGYATINGAAVTFHYYTQDYLGNNRAVINGSTGAIEQTVAYYTRSKQTI